MHSHAYASRAKQHVSDSIKIDNLRVAEPTQTTCWMGASSEPLNEAIRPSDAGVTVEDACGDCTC